MNRNFCEGCRSLHEEVRGMRATLDRVRKVADALDSKGATCRYMQYEAGITPEDKARLAAFTKIYENEARTLRLLLEDGQ